MHYSNCTSGIISYLMPHQHSPLNWTEHTLVSDICKVFDSGQYIIFQQGSKRRLASFMTTSLCMLLAQSLSVPYANLRGNLGFEVLSSQMGLGEERHTLTLSLLWIKPDRHNPGPVTNRLHCFKWNVLASDVVEVSWQRRPTTHNGLLGARISLRQMLFQVGCIVDDW